MIQFQTDPSLAPTDETLRLISSPLNSYLLGEQQGRLQNLQDLSLQDAQEVLRQRRLENERYGQMTPLELQKTGLEASRAEAMNTPEMLNAYTGGYKGQMQSQAAAGELANALLPFKKQAGQMEQTNLIQNFKLRRQLADMDNVLANGFDPNTGFELNPQQLQALSKERDRVAGIVASSPEQMGKEDLALLKASAGQNNTRNLLSAIRAKQGTDIPLTPDESTALIGDTSLAGTTMKKPLASTDITRNQRVIGGSSSALERIEALMQFDEGTNVGLMPNLTTKDGVMNAIRNYAGKKLSPDEAKVMNPVFVGLGRELATVEAMGVATGLKDLTDKMQSGMYFNPGEDDAYTTAMKVAEARQVIEHHLGAALNAGMFIGEQKKEAQRIIDKTKETIPYTIKDVAEAFRKSTGSTKPTIGEATDKAINKQTQSSYKVGDTKSINGTTYIRTEQGWVKQ